MAHIKRAILVLLAFSLLACNSMPVNAKDKFKSINEADQSKGDNPVWVLGAISCSRWSEGRKANDKIPGVFLLGLLDGMSMESSKSFLEGTDSASVFLWVDNYCQANPAGNVTEAATGLKQELIKRKNL